MGLFGKTNKAVAGDPEDGGEALIVPELASTKTDEEVIRLTSMWEQDYAKYAEEIAPLQRDNLNYWIGKQYNETQTTGTKKPLVDNLIFESLETFLPIATRANPEANVTPIGRYVSKEERQAAEKVAKDVRNALADEADRQRLRMILKGVTRNWAIYLIGCVKVTYDTKTQSIETKNILPSRLILDRHAEITPGGKYRGDYMGEKKRMTASKLIRLFPAKEAIIKAKCEANLGTKLNYIEWWTPTDTFFTLDKEVLGKYKNPNWNYDGTTTVTDPETGEKSEQEVRGFNHWEQPEYPYIFLTVFNIGRRPHDETALITQNIPLQDVVNRRYQQIDKNVDSQNNGIVLSGKYFTKEQAAEAASQLARGNPLWVPEGDIRASYVRDNAPSLAGDVFSHLNDARGELRNIFGTSGSTPEGTEGHKTVRGKILINQMDSSRIGGGVTEHLEQLADTIFNHWLQFMYVYFTDEHIFPSREMGRTPDSSQDTAFKNTSLQLRLRVTVKEGSLVPKDPMTKRNEAIDLWNAQAIDPITLYTRLDFPNPYESAKELLTWKLVEAGKLPPTMMFPDLQTPQVNPPDVTSPAINPEEAKAELNPAPGPNAQSTSQELLRSVPLV